METAEPEMVLMLSPFISLTEVNRQTSKRTEVINVIQALNDTTFWSSFWIKQNGSFTSEHLPWKPKVLFISGLQIYLSNAYYILVVHNDSIHATETN